MQAKALLLVAAALALLARPAAAQCNYVIQDGDNLSDLATQFNTNETELQKLNPQITNPEIIYTGDVLRLPCDSNARSGDNVADLLAGRQDMYTLLKALSVAGLLDKGLSDGSTSLTLFAPTDKAFTALEQELGVTAAELLNETDTTMLTDVLSYHVIPNDALYSKDLKSGKRYNTNLKGKQLTILKEGNVTYVETTSGQKVPIAIINLDAGNAVVHIINQVLNPNGNVTPPTAAPASTEAPPAASTEAGGSAPKPTPAPASGTYTVKEGDSLYSIAAMFGIDLAQLIKLNPQIEDPELIQPGQVIKLK